MFNERRDLSELKEHPTFSGFYQIPRFPLLYISLEQKILDSRDGIELMPYLGYFDYLKVDVVGLKSGILIHRAMAETFLDCGGEDNRRYQVNHKDGDKYNNKIENLEFVTRSQNSVHAFKIGLRSDNRKILCKDLRTGEIEKYYSMNDCGRHIAAHQATVSNYLKSDRKAPFLGVYELIMDGEEWKGFPSEMIKDDPKKRFVDVAVVSHDMKDVRIYRTILAASRGTGYSESFIRSAVFSRRKTSTKPEPYRFMLLEDFAKLLPDVPYTEVPHVKYSRGRKPRVPITVYDHNTGEESSWTSTQEFADFHHVDKKTVQKSMHNKNGRWCNFTITYNR